MQDSLRKGAGLAWTNERNWQLELHCLKLRDRIVRNGCGSVAEVGLERCYVKSTTEVASLGWPSNFGRQANEVTKEEGEVSKYFNGGLIMYALFI